jgi:predicted nucleotidyltransferase
LSQYAETIELHGIPVKAITLEGLLLTKRTLRHEDVADRIVIGRALEAFRLHAGGAEGDQGME